MELSGKTTPALTETRTGPHPNGESGDGNADEAIEAVPIYKNLKLVIPLFLVLVALVFFGWRWYLGLRDFVSTDDAFIDGYRVSVSSKILGRIDSLMADEGDTVRQGEVLVKLDDRDLRSQARQAEAAVALAQNNVGLANVNLEKATTDFNRASEQFTDNVITKEQYDNARSELEAARARLAIARAQTASAGAQAGIIETQLGNTVIAAPMSGIVAKRWALPGDVVQPGQAIFSITDNRNIWVTANLEETSLTALRLNDRVDISVDAYPGTIFTGRVLQIGSNTASQFSLIPPNNASGNFTKVTQRVPVKISIEQSDPPVQERPRPLLPGMSVEVRVKVR